MRDATDDSKELLRQFIDQAPSAIAMFDNKMRYIAASRRWLSDYGLGNRNLLGLSHYEVFPDIPERWRAIHRRGLGGEVVRAIEDRFDRPDGVVHWLRWEVRPWYDKTGQGSILIFTEDITELKRAEERFQLVVEASPSALVLVDEQGLIIRVNSPTEQMFGYNRTELLGQSVEKLVPEHLRTTHAELYRGFF